MTAAFSTFVPAGWASIDLSPLREDQLSAALVAVVGAVPAPARDAVRRYATPSIEGTVRALAERGGLRVLMPAAAFATSPIRPLIAILPLAGGVRDDADPVEYVVAIAQHEPSARMIEPPGMVGIATRTEKVTTARLQQGLQTLPADLAELAGTDLDRARALTRVTVEARYVIGVPGDPQRWVDVLATYSHEDVAAARDAAEAIGLFLDQWVNTVRWIDAA